jgi:hypothetical protein
MHRSTSMLPISSPAARALINKLKEQMQRLEVLRVQNARQSGSADIADGTRFCSMARSGRGSGVVGYNVKAAVDTANHLIITHEVTNVGSIAALGRGQAG